MFLLSFSFCVIGVLRRKKEGKFKIGFIWLKGGVVDFSLYGVFVREFGFYVLFRY